MDHQATHNTQLQGNRVKTGLDKSSEAVDDQLISTSNETMNDAILDCIDFSPTVMPYPNQQRNANSTGVTGGLTTGCG